MMTGRERFIQGLSSIRPKTLTWEISGTETSYTYDTNVVIGQDEDGNDLYLATDRYDQDFERGADVKETISERERRVYDLTPRPDANDPYMPDVNIIFTEGFSSYMNALEDSYNEYLDQSILRELQELSGGRHVEYTSDTYDGYEYRNHDGFFTVSMPTTSEIGISQTE